MVRSRISSRSKICLGESRVLFANLSLCSRRSFMMRRAWSMEMVVLSEVTSMDTIISSGSIFCWHLKVENDLELWCVVLSVFHKVLIYLQCILIFRRVEFLCMIRLVAEKHDSRHDKLRKLYEYN